MRRDDSHSHSGITFRWNAKLPKPPLKVANFGPCCNGCSGFGTSQPRQLTQSRPPTIASPILFYPISTADRRRGSVCRPLYLKLCARRDPSLDPQFIFSEHGIPDSRSNMYSVVMGWAGQQFEIFVSELFYTEWFERICAGYTLEQLGGNGWAKNLHRLLLNTVKWDFIFFWNPWVVSHSARARARRTSVLRTASTKHLVS